MNQACSKCHACMAPVFILECWLGGQHCNHYTDIPAPVAVSKSFGRSSDVSMVAYDSSKKVHEHMLQAFVWQTCCSKLYSTINTTTTSKLLHTSAEKSA